MTTWMIVEDEPDIPEVLMAMFEMWGIEGVAFLDGEEAIAWIEDVDAGRFDEELPEFALLDIRLPGNTSGVMIGERLRQSPKLRHIAIVLTTAYKLKDEEEADSLKRSGADRLLYKPLPRFNELQQLIEDTIARRKAQPEQAESRQDLTVHIFNSEKILLNKELQSVPKTVLVADDEIYTTHMIALILKMEGFDVLEVSSGAEALEITKLHTPSIIMTDLMMPGMTGLELITHVKSLPELRHIPCIILTAASSNWSTYAVKIGAIDYLTKPFGVQQLIAIVNRTYQSIPRVKGKANLKFDRILHVLIMTEGSQLDNLNTVVNELALKGFESRPVFNEGSSIGVKAQIAAFMPDAIVLHADNSLKNLQKLREFDLSQNLPLILVGEDESETQVLYTAGADQVCGTDQQEVAWAVESAIKQYQSPALIETGDSWQILITSPNRAMCEQIAADLTGTYYTDTVFAENLADCLNHLRQHLDLLILDTEIALNSIEMVIRQIRENTDSPVILIGSQNTLSLKQQFELGVRAIWTNPVSKEQITLTIERLLRYRREPKPLLESWAQYHILMTEAEYESQIRKQQPRLASIMEETGALYSGLIHDLRNSVYALNSQITMLQKRLKDSTPDIVTLQQSVVYANVLIEQIANGRFKASWNPKHCDGEMFAKAVEEAITLARQARSNATFWFEKNPKPESTQIVMDEAQFVTAITSLLIALAAHRRTTVVIELDNNARDFILTFRPLRWKEETIQRFVNQIGKKLDLPLLTTDRLVRRHRGRINANKGKIVLTLPKVEWDDDLTLRLEIAHAADRYETLHEQMKAQVKSDTQVVEVGPLITETAVELTQYFAKIVRHTLDLGEAGQRLQTAARFGLLLASNLLVTSAGYKPQPRPLDLAPLFDNLYQLREDKLKNCKVTMQIEPGTPPVLADEIGLTQVLVNLLTNALEAMSGAGELAIRAIAHPDGVEITVSDTGSGIPPEQLNRIFDLFYTTKQGQERGVGLHIVTSIVHQFGGRVNAQSTVGEGTTFIVILPAVASV